MNRTEALRTLIEAAPREPIVFSPGHVCRIAEELADRPNHFHLTGATGLAASIATGVALAGRMHAVAVECDGSLLMMNQGSLVTADMTAGMTAGKTADLPLVHVLLDDGGAGASTGSGPVPGPARTDFAAWARACGYVSARCTDDPVEFAVLLRRALETSAPSFIHCVLTERDEPAPPPRIEREPAGHFRRFSRHVATL